MPDAEARAPLLPVFGWPVIALLQGLRAPEVRRDEERTLAMKPPPLFRSARFNEDMCAGAGIFVCVLIDLFTLSGKKSFTREEVVLVLDSIGKRELPPGLIDKVKEIADFRDREGGDP